MNAQTLAQILHERGWKQRAADIRNKMLIARSPSGTRITFLLSDDKIKATKMRIETNHPKPKPITEILASVSIRDLELMLDNLESPRLGSIVLYQ